MQVSAIVPAAGLATRMGGPNKMLLPWGGSTVIRATVSALVGAVEEVVVVTGRDADAVEAEVAGLARAVFNPDYRAGLGGSIAAGVAAVKAGNALLIALGDMPGIRAEVVHQMVRLLDRDEPSIVRPVYSLQPGIPGHPVLFHPAYRRQLLGLRGEDGGRSILVEHGAAVLLCPVEGELPDLDHEQDLT